MFKKTSDLFIDSIHGIDTMTSSDEKQSTIDGTINIEIDTINDVMKKNPSFKMCLHNLPISSNENKKLDGLKNGLNPVVKYSTITCIRDICMILGVLFLLIFLLNKLSGLNSNGDKLGGLNSTDSSKTNEIVEDPKYDSIDDAIENGDLNSVDLLIRKKKIDPNKIYDYDYDDTLLHLAVEKGHLEIVKYLCKMGADPYVKNYNEKLPLHYGCLYGHLEIVKFFIKDIGMSANLRSRSKETCLHFAVCKNKIEMVKFLCENGAYLLAKNEDGNTPMDTALNKNRAVILNYLENFKKSKQ